MPLVSKIDSNLTGLSYAEEETPGVLPGSPTWKALEPNGYNNFGAEIKTVSRNPIQRGRQRKKGVITDLDAQGGFSSDITQTNMQDLLQGVLMADFRRKPEVVASEASIKAVVDASPDYYLLNNLHVTAVSAVADGGTGYTVGDILTVSGGTAVTAATLRVLTAPGGVIATVEIVEDGLYSVAPSNDVSVTGGTGSGAEFTLTFGNLVTFLANHLVFVSGITAANNNGLKLVSAFSTSGTHVETAATLVADATVAAGADMVAVGYQFATSTLNMNATLNSYPRLERASGAFDFTTLGLIPGETIFIGGDQAAEKFSTAANNGFARVRAVAANYIELDKTAAVSVDETGTGKTVRIFFGRCLKNEEGDDVVQRTYQLERSLGAPDTDDPSAVQAEYLTKVRWNEFNVKVPTADKVTVDLVGIAGDSEIHTADDGLKSGTRVGVTEADAFNTSSDVARIKLAQVVDGDSCPDPLFSYLEEANVNVNNNITPDKAVGVLGAFDVTVGTLAVGGDLQAYFATVEAISAVRDNVDITFEIHFAKANAGISIDLPLVTLSNAKPDVAPDVAVKIPLTMEAANGIKIDTDLDHTIFMVFFDYLPDAAEN